MTEELKHFVEEYFKVFPHDNVCYLVAEESFDDYLRNTVSMFSKKDYNAYLKELIEEDNETAYKPMIQYFNDNYQKIIRNIPSKELNPNDIMSLGDSNYCGWVVKRDNPTEIVYEPYGNI